MGAQRGTWDTLVAAGDSTTWNPEEWEWDPLTLRAQPRSGSLQQQGAAGAQPAQPASAPRACRSGASLAGPFLMELGGRLGPALCAGGDGEEGREEGGLKPSPPVAAAPPAAGPSDSSEGGGGGGSAPPAPAAEVGSSGSGDRPAASGAQQGAGRRTMCQADDCTQDLATLTYYHQRNKICADHIKANEFLRDGQRLRFCQRCGHPHELAEFDAGKHSCRKQLEKHNARRRKRQEQQKAAGRGRGQQQQRRRRPKDEDDEAEEEEQEGEKAEKGSAGSGDSGQPPEPRRQRISRAAEAPSAGASAGSARPRRRSAPPAAWPQPPLLRSQQEASSGETTEGKAMAGLGPAAPAHPQAAAPVALPATSAAGNRSLSPALPLLDFALEPTPFDQLQEHDAALADDLSTWLTQQLVGQPSAANQQQHAPLRSQPVAGSTIAGLSTAQAHMPYLSGMVPPQLQTQQQQQQQQHADSFALASSLMQQLGAPHTLGMMRPAQPTLGGGLVPTTTAGFHQPPPQQQMLPPAMAPAPPMLLPQHPHNPVQLSTISVKLFGATPAELPANLREQLTHWFDDVATSLEGYIRPGCVHLTVQAVLEPPGQGGDARSDSPPAAAGTQATQPATQPEVLVYGHASAEPHQPGGSCCGRKRPAPMPAPGDAPVRRVVARMLESGEPMWRSKTLLVQAEGHVALVHQGQLRQTWDVATAPLHRAVPAVVKVSHLVLLAEQPAPLTVSGINLLQNDCQLLLRLQGSYLLPVKAGCADCLCKAPTPACCASADAGAASVLAAANGSGGQAGEATWEQRCCGCCTSKLQLVGLHPSASAAAGTTKAEAAAQAAAAGMTAGCCGREGVPTTQRLLASAAAAATATPSCCQQATPAAGAAGAAAVSATPPPAQLQAVRLQLGGGLTQGLLHMEVQKGAYMAAKGARALVVSSPAVQQELLALQQGRPGVLEGILDQLGVVFEWAGRPEKVPYAVAERTAARLLYWAVACALPATACVLLSVLQWEGGTSSAVAASALRRALKPAAGQGPAASKQDLSALRGLDSLGMLHLTAQTCTAAALHRAEQLGCVDGLSLLHRAVQSGCHETLNAVLAWGEEACCAWRCDLAGPMGLTPLHLSAAMPNHATSMCMALLLVQRCEPGPGAWFACCASDGLTPSEMATRAGNITASAVLAALPPSPSTQQQQPQQQQQTERVGQSLRVGLKPPTGGAKRPAPSLAPPSTPRRCMCDAGCPCAQAATPCASCFSSAGSVMGDACCGMQGGKCACCADAESRQVPSRPSCCGGR